MTQIPKVCRFCMHEDNNSNNPIIDVFNNNLKFLYENISNCTGMRLTPADVIPPLICKSCVNCVENFTSFLETIKNSDKVLHTLYHNSHSQKNVHQEKSRHQISEEQIENPHTNWQLVPKNCDKGLSLVHNDDFLDCDSSSSYHSFDNRTIKPILKRSRSPSPPNNEATLYFSGGKKVRLFDENARRGDASKKYVCTVCSKSFDAFFEYQDHQESHNGQLVFCCSKCEEVFADRTKLVEHEKSHKINCKVCNVQVLPKSFAAHMKKHTDSHKCTSCNARHTSRAALEQHFKGRHAGMKGFVCHICGKQNSCQSSMKKHIATHNHERPHKCKYCNFTTKSKAILNVHTSRKHTAQKCICEVCAKMFKSELSLRQHKKRIHNPKKHKCNICGKAFSEKFNLDKHVERKHSKQRIFECQVCCSEFFSAKQLKKHMYEHRQTCYDCPECGQKFSYKKLLEKHMTKCPRHTKGASLELKSSRSMPNTSINFLE